MSSIEGHVERAIIGYRFYGSCHRQEVHFNEGQLIITKEEVVEDNISDVANIFMAIQTVSSQSVKFDPLPLIRLVSSVAW